MNEETPGEKYERGIIERLSKMEREGKGRIVELCQLTFDGRTLPFVAFTTGETALVTAGFCPYAAFGTYETVLEICNRGIEGITSFPTVTPEEYGEVARKIERTELTSVELVRDLFGLGILGESDEPATFRMYPQFKQMGWDDSQKPEPTRRILELLDRSKVILDLRNGYTLDASYILFSSPVEKRIQSETDRAIIDGIESQGYRLAENASGLYPVTGRGVIFYGPHDKLCTTSSGRGILNYVINVPTVTYMEGEGIRIVGMQNIVETNIAAITRVVRLLR